MDDTLKDKLRGLQLELAVFIADGKGKFPQRIWFESPCAKVYVRSYERQSGAWFDIAYIEVAKEHRRKGICRAIFSYAEELCVAAGYFAIRVENVCNPRLFRFLEQRGYLRTAAEPKSLYRKMSDIHLTS